MRDLGFRGVMVCTHANGTDWDDPSLFPILEAAAALGAVVYYHPMRGRANSWMGKYHLRNLIGNPLETTMALACLIFGGVFDKLPNLKTCFSHAGGYGVLGIGRFDHGHEVRPEATGIAHLPSDYVRRIWVDTITHSERTLRYIVDTVGADRVVLGSDYPADMGEPYPAGFIESCGSLSERRRWPFSAATPRNCSGSRSRPQAELSPHDLKSRIGSAEIDPLKRRLVDAERLQVPGIRHPARLDGTGNIDHRAEPWRTPNEPAKRERAKSVVIFVPQVFPSCIATTEVNSCCAAHKQMQMRHTSHANFA